MSFFLCLGEGVELDFAKGKNNRNIAIVYVGFLPPSKCKLHNQFPVLGEKIFLGILCNKRLRKFFTFGNSRNERVVSLLLLLYNTLASAMRRH